MNEHGPSAGSELRTLRRRRRTRRGLVAGYIHELSARHDTSAASRKYELGTTEPIQRVEGG